MSKKTTPDETFLFAIKHHDEDMARRAAIHASSDALWEGVNIVVSHHMTDLFVDLLPHLDWNDAEKVGYLWKHVIWNSFEDICDILWNTHPINQPLSLNFQLTSFIEQGNMEMVKRFVPWMECRSNNGLNQSIQEAICHGHVEMLTMLLQHHGPEHAEIYLQSVVRGSKHRSAEMVDVLAPLCSWEACQRVVDSNKEWEQGEGMTHLHSLCTQHALGLAVGSVEHLAGRVPKM